MDRDATPETIETLALELDEVEWFGRSTTEQTPAPVGPLDRLLQMMTGTIAAGDEPCPAR
ncbi:hypothetical protein [Paraliomyxa miuraensis]|uniref:hypothetical protein n=1 Tax=Paraliomyxa miuraensis TaxID=376150 RepID=UPI00224F66FE|nr:hypothetical protein [Paraliomyxa miuraensis]MCX4245951.1 hypothetical protein [Paraliomyxa miuraensis]